MRVSGAITGRVFVSGLLQKTKPGFYGYQRCLANTADIALLIMKVILVDADVGALSPSVGRSRVNQIAHLGVAVDAMCYAQQSVRQ